MKVADLYKRKPKADAWQPPGYSQAEHVRRLYAVYVEAGWHPEDARRRAERDAAAGFLRNGFPDWGAPAQPRPPPRPPPEPPGLFDQAV